MLSNYSAIKKILELSRRRKFFGILIPYKANLTVIYLPINILKTPAIPVCAFTGTMEQIFRIFSNPIILKMLVDNHYLDCNYKNYKEMHFLLTTC